MKFAVTFLLMILAGPFSNAQEKAASDAEDWMMLYYQNPSPEKFVSEVRSLLEGEQIADPSGHPPMVGFLSQVMAKNPAQIQGWMEELSDLGETGRQVLLSAAWFSHTQESRDYFKSEKLESYLEKKAPKILEMTVESPATLDMLWGSFFATGEEAPVRRVVSSLGLSKYAGALDEFQDSEKGAEDQRKAYLDVTFQAAQWSLESLCRQNPLVLKHCETILADKNLPKDQQLWLGVILSKVKPKQYQIEIGE